MDLQPGGEKNNIFEYTPDEKGALGEITLRTQRTSPAEVLWELAHEYIYGELFMSALKFGPEDARVEYIAANMEACVGADISLAKAMPEFAGYAVVCAQSSRLQRINDYSARRREAQKFLKGHI